MPARYRSRAGVPLAIAGIVSTLDRSTDKLTEDKNPCGLRYSRTMESACCWY